MRAKVPLQYLEGDFVVEERVVIVHLLIAGTVMVYNVAGGDALAKVGLPAWLDKTQNLLAMAGKSP